LPGIVDIAAKFGSAMGKSIMDLVKEAKAVVPDIDPEDVKSLIGRDDVLIVDVRDDGEVAATGKVRGALHVSRGMLEFRGMRQRLTTMRPSRRTRRSSFIVPSAGGPRWAERPCWTSGTRKSGTLADFKPGSMPAAT